MSAMDPSSELSRSKALRSVGEQEPSVYRVGTLVYTFRGLLIVFGWMLFGDFCFTMMESLVPSLLPLTLKDIGGSNATIGLLVGTIPALFNMVLTPILGYKSDRHRGPRGRRIPYLLWPTPIVTASLILLAFSNDIGDWIHRTILSSSGISESHILLITVGVCVVLFQFFNMFIASVYYWLFNDVVPAHLMGRFYALIRVVGSTAGFVFNRYVLGLADMHMRTIYVGVAIIYFVSFMLLCRNVEEGEYPPPEAAPDIGWTKSAMIFIRECFTIPYYWWFYLAYALMTVGGLAPQLFRILFAKQLGISLDATGKILSWGAIVGVVMYYPLGVLADKIHPLRLYIIAMAIMIIVSVLSVCEIKGPDSFWVLTIIWYVGWACNLAANAPLFPVLLPKEQFGQFASAASVIASGMVMIGNYCSGKLIDYAGSYYVVYWWQLACTLGAIGCAVMIYRGWLRHGGDAKYIAPVRSESHVCLSS
ncbi:MAG TPA: MFS transporter [Tepidisphaeraceae bacterium]|nr:MFS transporter [Tepidisphaeraceae bacterium]